MSSLLTRYIRQSESAAPNEHYFDQALKELAKMLRFEMRRRGLLSAPPRYLGIVGASFDARDTFTDLLYDAYAFCILDRLSPLQRQAKATDIDGFIRLNVRLFLFERQRQHDPIGYRVFDIAREAVGKSIDRGVLESSSEPNEKITASTLLGLPPLDHTAEARPLDDEMIARWCEQLMPDLVTAYRRQGVIDRLDQLISELRSTDLSAFLLRDLVEPLKTMARRRAIAMLTEAELAIANVDGAAPDATPDGQHLKIDFLVQPSSDFEERQTLKHLLDCIQGKIDRRPGVKECSYLRRLLDFLALWSAMMDEGTARGRPGDAEIARRLDIPRGRIPQLLSTLSQMTSACRDARGFSSDQGPPGGKMAKARSEPMTRNKDQDKRREALRRATVGKTAGEAAGENVKEKTAATDHDSITPADIVTWSGPGHAEPTEWLVVSWTDDGGRLVPVDPAPLRGSRDLDLSSAAGEPLFARLGQSLEISSTTHFQAVWRLPAPNAPEALEAVTRRLQVLATETPPAIEIDEAPLYLEHIESLEAARAFLMGTSTPTSSDAGNAESDTESNVVEISRRRPASSETTRIPWSTLLAAAFALMSVGIGFHSMHLQKRLKNTDQELASTRQELDEANAPRFVESEFLRFGRVRGSVSREVLRPKGDRIILDIVFTSIEQYPAYELRLIEEEGGSTILSQRLLDLSPQTIDLPTTPGSFRLVLFGVGSADSVVEIHTKLIDIVVAEEQDADTY